MRAMLTATLIAARRSIMGMVASLLGCLLGAFGILTAGSDAFAQQAKLPNPESGNYSQFCTEKWTKRGVLDSQMFDYCMRRQIEGDRTLADLAEKYPSLPRMQQVIDEAIKKWTKRGLRDEAMVAYEVSHQVDAYLDVVYASKQGKFKSDVLAQCSAKWQVHAPDWVMTLYCYKLATGTD
jgi:hypothetical protein